MMLSSDTEQMTQGSLGFQEKSEILAVWPPWINLIKDKPPFSVKRLKMMLMIEI